MSKRPAQNGDHGAWEANGEAPAQKVKVDPAQDGLDKPSDEVRPNISSGMFRSCGDSHLHQEHVQRKQTQTVIATIATTVVWLGNTVAAAASDRHPHCRIPTHSPRSTLADDACTQASAIA